MMMMIMMMMMMIIIIIIIIIIIQSNSSLINVLDQMHRFNYTTNTKRTKRSELV